MTESLTAAELGAILDPLTTSNSAVTAANPGELGADSGLPRQPSNACYVSAAAFTPETTAEWAKIARHAMMVYAPDDASFARACGLDSLPAEAQRALYVRVRAKLAADPVEMLVIDFEDGFGIQTDAIEDQAAIDCAHRVAKAMALNSLPPATGIRIKCFNEEFKRRGARTLDLFLTTLIGAAGRLPAGFSICLAKISTAEQVAGLAALCNLLEQRLNLPADSLKIEAMVELPQTLYAPDGAALLPRIVTAGGRRLIGAHIGVYDFTATCDITAAVQALDHPLADALRAIVRIQLSQRGPRLSNGSTHLNPIGPFDESGDLTSDQRAKNRAAVWQAWAMATANIRSELRLGFYQGWDMHPAHLVSRYAGAYSFYQGGFAAAAARLSTYLARAGQATVSGQVFDEYATGQGLLNFVQRAVACGAVDPSEATAIGLTADDLAARSFRDVLTKRQTPQETRR